VLSSPLILDAAGRRIRAPAGCRANNRAAQGAACRKKTSSVRGLKLAFWEGCVWRQQRHSWTSRRRAALLQDRNSGYGDREMRP